MNDVLEATALFPMVQRYENESKSQHQCLCMYRVHAVSNGSKILKWKQITTKKRVTLRWLSCFQWFKDTKMKANHNNTVFTHFPGLAVSNGSKILKWKQITTNQYSGLSERGCFQWFKDTKMKANHNRRPVLERWNPAVSNGSKILKWKQITTLGGQVRVILVLFPMVQRY